MTLFARYSLHSRHNSLHQPQIRVWEIIQPRGAEYFVELRDDGQLVGPESGHGAFLRGFPMFVRYCLEMPPRVRFFLLIRLHESRINY
jgi:hypothetical protein